MAPSPGEDYQSWSITAIDNGSSDPLINWVEGQARASVNNSSRSQMAAHAKNRNLLNGSIVTTGAANAQAFQSGVSYTTIPSGLRATLKVGGGLTNDASMTLNMDGIGAVLVKTADGANLLGGEFVGDGYVDVLYNGANWIFLYSREFFLDLITGGDGIIIGKQIFTTPGTSTYTPTPGAEAFIIECIGGGGGGGGCIAGSQAAQTWYGSPGGGSGGYSRKLATAVDIGGSQVITVGAAGTGGTPSAPAATGGATSVGSLCIANGGIGGQSSPGLPGGAGGDPGTGDLAAGGAPGQPGTYAPNGGAVAWGGGGGSSAFGGGAKGTAPTAPGFFNGANATPYGSGGGGGVSYNSGSAASGGNGSAGVVIITEFAGRGAPGRDGATGPQGPAGPSGAGTGDVLRTIGPVPTAGQWAQWTDASHIQGVAAPTGFSTGDAKITLKTVADADWVLMDDGTIGSATSGASTRANADTQALFTLLFNNINDTYAPILTSAGAATTRAAQSNAATAYAANCRMTLTRQLGRSLSIAGAGVGLTSCVLGQFDGEERHTQTIAEMPSHDHAINADSSGGPTGTTNYVAAAPTATTNATRTQFTGGGAPMPIIQPRSFWNIMIKL